MTEAQEVFATKPLPTLDFEQLYDAIRVYDPTSDVHFVVDLVIPPGTTIKSEAPLPIDRMCCQRVLSEWGDPCVKAKWAFDTKDNVAISEHFCATSPLRVECHKYWEKRNVAYFWITNTDPVNSAEYHLSGDAVMPREKDWDEIFRPKISEYAKELIGIK